MTRRIESLRERRDRDPLPGIRTHGPGGYNRGCRCDACTDGLAARQKRTRLRKRGLLPPWSPPPRTHGTRSTYVHGCRCSDCTRAEREWRRAYRARGGA